MGICYYKGEIFIVTEFIDGGDLGSLLANKNVDFTWKIMYFFLKNFIFYLQL